MTLLNLGLAVLALTPQSHFDRDSLTNGFAVGVQAWTFTRFTACEAIQKTAEAGGKLIELFPGQTLSADMQDSKVGPDMSPEVLAKLKEQLAKYKVKVTAFGVTGIPKDETQARKLFTWAKGLGIVTINTESTGSIDTIEKMVKEFDIRVGFHNHPRSSNADYKVWDPAYIYDLVKDRDPRIGSCADTGHWVRSGIKPVDAIRTLHGRIVSSHLKDLHEFSPGGHDVPFGTGQSDIKGILAEYKKIGFQGPISIEYEYNWENSVPDVKKCLEFVRDVKL